MTARAPTWGEIEDFLRIDGWRRLPAGARGGRRSRHVFFEKMLPDGRVLQTHISHSRRGEPSPGRFSLILREQLEVSRQEFFETLRSKVVVERPIPLDDDQPVEHPAWVAQVLASELRMSAKTISELTPEEAEARVHEHWARNKEDRDE